MRQWSPLFFLSSSCSLLVGTLTDVPFCGDGILDPDEECDDANQDETDGCTAQCLFFCGDQLAEVGQICDGSDLKGESCTTLGFDAGALSCLSDCSGFDTTACIAESCTNGIDDGADGLIDCVDLANCQAQCSDACLLPTPADPNGGISGSTLNHTDSRSGGCQTAGGGDVVFHVEITTTGVLRLSLDSDTAQGMFVTDDCAAGIQRGCADSPEVSLGVLATAGETLFVYVSASSLGQEGPFTLTLENVVVACGDGVIDAVAGEECEPPGSATCDASCLAIESDCENQIDDDADGLLDCDDPNECQTLAECAPGASITGDACVNNNQCDTIADNDPFCFTEALNGFPAGYCSEFCSVAQDDCAGDGVCVSLGDIVEDPTIGFCIDGCEPANGDADCTRAGYTCQGLGAQGEFGCLPGCSDNAQCQVLAGCNIDTGFCVATLEDCAVALDEDADTLINCEDADCRANVALCPLAAECAAATVLVAQSNGSTVLGTDDFRGSCFVTGNAREQVFSFTTPGSTSDSGFLTLQLQSATSQGVYIRRDCVDPTSELNCFVGAIEQTTPIEGGTDISVFVDAAFPGAEGPFALTVIFDLISEVEPNDSVAAANPFVAPFIGESSAVNDQDFVSMDVPANILLTAQLDEIFAGDCAGDITGRVEILDQDGVTIIDTSEAGCKPAVGFIATAGTYFVRVFGANNTLPYELLLTQTPVDESEDNNSAVNADAFVDGFLGGLITGDQDFVSFVVSGDSATLLAEVTDVGSKDCALGALDTQLAIFDTDGATLLVTDDNSGAGACSFAFVKDLSAGTYFVRVTSDGANVPYRLAIAEATEVEPNDNLVAANLFVAPFFGSIEDATDEDFIQVNVPANADLVVEVRDGGDGACLNNALDSELELFGPGLVQALKNDDLAAQNFCSRIVANNLIGGIYSIRVGSSQLTDPNGTFLYEFLVTIQ